MVGFSVFSLVVWASVIVAVSMFSVWRTLYRKYFITSQGILIFTYKMNRWNRKKQKQKTVKVYYVCIWSQPMRLGSLVAPLEGHQCPSLSRCSLLARSSRKLRLTPAWEKTSVAVTILGYRSLCSVLQPEIMVRKRGDIETNKQTNRFATWNDAGYLGTRFSLRRREEISGKTLCLSDVWPCEMLEKSWSGLRGLMCRNLSCLCSLPVIYLFHSWQINRPQTFAVIPL